MQKSQKHLVQLDQNVHYLNCAYKAPLLKTAEEKVQQALMNMRNPQHLGPDDYFDGPEQAHRLFATLVNCTAEEVAIMPSTSYGFANALNNVCCPAGSNAVTVDKEFPSGYLSLKAWCDKNNAELRVAGSDASHGEKGADWNQRILESIDENTAVVLMSSVHWMNGLKFDLEAIGKKCKEMKAVFIVDGTQSVGAMPMDVERYHIDALICATYKWLFGPYSMALGYFGPYFHQGVPIEQSWMNRTNAKNFASLTDYDMQYKPKAARYNVGEMTNMLTMPVLLEGLQHVLHWNPENLQSYAAQLSQPLFEYLTELDVPREPKAYTSAHLFGLQLPDRVDGVLLQKNLKENNISLSVRGTTLRVAVHLFNDEADVQALISAIQKAVR